MLSIAVQSGTYLKRDVEAVEKLQQRAAQWICCRWDKHTHKWSRTYNNAIHHLGWNTLETRRKIQIIYAPRLFVLNHLDCIPFDSYYLILIQLDLTHSPFAVNPLI